MSGDRSPDAPSGVEAALPGVTGDLFRDPSGVVRRVLRGDELLQHGSIVAAATVVSGAFNYAFQVFVGRALGPEQFGVFGALFALFYLGTVLGRGVRFSASRFVAEFDRRDPGLASFYRGFLLRAGAFGAVLLLAIVATSPAIAAFLGVESPWLVVLALASVPTGIALAANRGTFQGLQWFVPLGGYDVLVAAVKLALAVGLVLTGFGLHGAFGANLAATALVLAVATGHLLRRLPRSAGTRRAASYRRAYRYAPPAVLAGFCVTVPGTVDVIVVQRAVAGSGAGLYTAVSVLGKALVFLPLGVCAALFPKVSDGHVAAAERDLDGLLTRGLCYCGAVAGAGALVYALLPGRILGLFFGAEYAAAAGLLRWYGAAMVAFALAAVVLNVELARDRTRFVYVFAAGSVVEIGLLWVVSGSLVGLAQVILLVNAALFGYGLYEVRS